jgi:predicted RNA-binding protein YlqC (UPF0109 family)
VDRRNELRIHECFYGWSEIASVSDPDGSVFQIHAHIANVTKLIGRDGETARALQIIVGDKRSAGRQPIDIDAVLWGDTR